VSPAAARPQSSEHACTTRRAPQLVNAIVTAPVDVADVSQVDAPALVLHGRHDPIVPLEYGTALSAALPNAELVVFEHSEHIVTRTEPERYRDVVGRFLAAHAPPSARPAAPA